MRLGAKTLNALDVVKLRTITHFVSLFSFIDKFDLVYGRLAWPVQLIGHPVNVFMRGGVL